MDILQLVQQHYVYLLIAAGVLLLFRNRILSRLFNLQYVTPEAAFSDYKKPSGTLFLDVRTKWELERQHRIRRAKEIPLSDLKQRLPEVSSKTDRKVIIVCHSGSRAVSAAIRLKKAGMSNVFVLAGGINAWYRSDYPVLKPKKSKKQTYG